MSETSEDIPAERAEFAEGADFYFEQGLMVLTAEFLRKRGYCCDNDCRHCPYPKAAKSLE